MVEGVALVVPQWLLQAEIKEGRPALQREPDLKMRVSISSETFKYWKKKKTTHDQMTKLSS